MRTGPKGRARKRLWSDFGGGREAIDVDAADTASREFAEETLGLFHDSCVRRSSVAHSAASMALRLRQGAALEVVHTLKKVAGNVSFAGGQGLAMQQVVCRLP